MTQKTIVVARYVRNSDLSKKDTEVQKAQADALDRYAFEHGYDCPANLLYADAISALKHPYWERDRLMDLLDDAEAHLFDAVLCTEFFRVARTTPEQYAIMEYLKRYNIQLISISEKFEDTTEGRLLHAIQGFLGEVEAEKIRIRTQRGKRHRAERGLTGQGKYPTYGYVWVDGEQYTRQRYALKEEIIYTDEQEQDWTESTVIRFCNQACRSGKSLRQIAFELTRRGVPTPRGGIAWDPSTIQKFLTNICYTGQGFNGRYSKSGIEGRIALGSDIYPPILEEWEYEDAQKQLLLNKEMSPRNNQHPRVGTLRGLVYCGICQHKMQEKHYNHPGKRHKKIKDPSYMCYQNDGIEDILHHHTVVMDLHNADRAAWDFVLPYLRNQTRLREYINSLKEQIGTRDHTSDLEKDLDKIKKSIANLYRLAEAADPDDEDGMQALQERLVALEKQKRSTENLFIGLSTAEEKQEKLRAALDKFERWITEVVVPHLDDRSYVFTYDDLREIMLVMGVKLVIWPANQQYMDRYKLSLLPPDVARFCDYDFTK